MAREPKTKSKSAANGQKPKLDAKLAKLVEKRTKKLRQQLADATRLERKRVRALDKAHRRRQLLEAALGELLTGKPAPVLPDIPAPVVAAPKPAPATPPVAAAPKRVPAKARAKAPAKAPVATAPVATAPVAAAPKRAPVRRPRSTPAPKA